MRALVLSGGGSKGAWQAGAIDQLLRDRGRTHDLYCGVSAGALNAAFLSMYGPGAEGTGARDLVEVWRSLRTSSVRRAHRPFGLLEGLWLPSLYDSHPLQELVRARIEPARSASSGKRLRVGAVSLTTGRYRLFDETSPHLADAVLASSAFPAMLAPVEVDGDLCTDGGLRDVTPLAAAIDAGATSVDVLLTSPPEIAPRPVVEGRRLNAVRLAVRALEILLHEVVENDLTVAVRTNELVRRGAAPGKREVQVRVLRPSVALPGDPLDFSPPRIAEMLAQGHADARTFDTV